MVDGCQWEGSSSGQEDWRVEMSNAVFVQHPGECGGILHPCQALPELDSESLESERRGGESEKLELKFIFCWELR